MSNDIYLQTNKEDILYVMELEISFKKQHRYMFFFKFYVGLQFFP